MEGLEFELKASGIRLEVASCALEDLFGVNPFDDFTAIEMSWITTDKKAIRGFLYGSVVISMLTPKILLALGAEPLKIGWIVGFSVMVYPFLCLVVGGCLLLNRPAEILISKFGSGKFRGGVILLVKMMQGAMAAALMLIVGLIAIIILGFAVEVLRGTIRGSPN